MGKPGGRLSGKRSRGKRWILGLCVLAFVFVGVDSTLRSEGFRNMLADRLEELLSVVLEEDVLLGKVEAQLFRPRLSVEGLVIRSREGGHVIATLERGSVWPGLNGLRPTLRLVELDRPVVKLALQDGQLVDLPGLRGDVPGSGELPDRFPWEGIIVRDGTLDLTLAQSDHPSTELALAGIQIRPALGTGNDLRVGTLDILRGDFEEHAQDLWLPGATLGPDRVILPEIDIGLDLLQVEGRFGMILRGTLKGQLAIQVDSERLGELLEGVDLEGPLSADLEIGGYVSDPRVIATLFAEPTVIAPNGRFDLGIVTGVAEVDPGGAWLRDIRLDAWGGEISVNGRVGLDGAVSDGSVVLDDISLSDTLIALGDWTAPWIDMQADGEIGLAGTLNPFDLRGDFSLNTTGLSIGDGPAHARGTTEIVALRSGHAAGRVRFEAGGVELDVPKLVLGPTRGALGGYLPFSPTRDMRLEIELPQADLSMLRPLADIELEGRGRLSGVVQGPYSDLVVTGSAELKDFAVLGIPFGETLRTQLRTTDNFAHLLLEDFDALRGQTHLRGNLALNFDSPGMELDMIVGQGRIVDLTGMFLELPELDGDVSGTLALSGPYLELDGDSQLELSNVVLVGERFDRGVARGRMEQGLFTLDHMQLDRADGSERLVGSGTVVRGWALDARVAGSGFHVETLDAMADAPNTLRGRVGLDMRVGGTLMVPEPEGALVLTRASVRGESLADAGARFETSDGVLVWNGSSLDNRLKGSGAVKLWEGLAWELESTAQRFPAHVLLPEAADGQPLLALLSGTLVASGGAGAGVVVDAEATRTNLNWDGRMLETAQPWTYHRSAQAWVLAGVRVEGQNTMLTAEAQGDLTGFEATVDGHIGAHWLLAVTEDLDRAEGRIYVDADVRGPGAGRSGQVRLRLEDAAIRSPHFPEQAVAVNGAFELRHDRIVLDQIRGELGGGSAAITGSIESEDWVPVAYELRAEVDDARVRYLDEWLPPMVGDARLELSGPAELPLLGGEVEIEDMLFAERIDWERWTVDFREDRLVDAGSVDVADPALSFDIRVVADETVRFDNNVADGVGSAELQIIGDNTRVGMLGDVRMDRGEIFIQEHAFHVTRAELHYLDPYSFDPELDFLLETTIRSSNRSYTIFYPVTGPFSAWRTDPRSDPALSQGDINALLLFGVTREELERSGGVGAALAVEGLDLLVTGESSRALERYGTEGLSEVLGYARVDLVTGVSQRGAMTTTEWRLLVEKDAPELGDVTLIGEFSLEDQYLGIDKQLGGNLYLNAFWASQQRERSLDIGGAYGANVELRWDVD